MLARIDTILGISACFSRTPHGGRLGTLEHAIPRKGLPCGAHPDGDITIVAVPTAMASNLTDSRTGDRRL